MQYRKTTSFFVIGCCLEPLIISYADFSKCSPICRIHYSCKTVLQLHINTSSVLYSIPIDSLIWDKNLPMVSNN